MKLTLLPTGYWHARWNSEVWAQWPVGSLPTADDFFHNTSTPERLAQLGS